MLDDRARIPRPVALVIVGAILAATGLALFWPSLPWSEARRIVVGPTKVGIIDRQIDNGGSGRVGESAPAFEWIAPDGRRLSLATLGKPAVVNFWATWCVPCFQEHPVLAHAAQENPGVQFLGVVYEDDEDQVKGYLERQGGAYPNLMDADDKTAIAFGVFGVPETYFIDAQGTIVAKFVGPLDERSLAENLGKAMGPKERRDEGALR